MFARDAYRPRRTPLAIVGMLVCRTIARLVVLAGSSGLPSILSRRGRARYAPGFVIVSVNRLLHRNLGELDELTKYGWSLGLVPTPLWFRHAHGLRRWVGYERERGEPRINASTHWFVRIDVDPGLESFAVALLRLDAAAAIWFGRVHGWRSVRSVTCASRWPEFVVVSEPGNPAFTADTEALLDARYQASDPSGRARVAVVDTGFDPPPYVNVIVDNEAVAPPVAASIHGAAVCSLISRSCPAVTIELYPVLRADGKVDAGAVFEALQAISAGPPVDIVNLSLSVTGYHYPTQTAILLGQMMTTTREQHETRSTVFVAATGNAGARERMKLPARLDVTLGVGCLEPDGKLWPGSCRGPKDGVLPDAWLVAQGVELTYGSGGTSYAAASVTGLLAVLISRGMDPLQAAQRLLIDARKDLPGYAPLSHGAGQARYSSSAAGNLV